ncbi:MAG TPA: Ig-like domain-containing protein, partial [Longimicrobium sp.]|nr:Ig-like domain-containing protein [Longimicrobium sp.]
ACLPLLLAACGRDAPASAEASAALFATSPTTGAQLAVVSGGVQAATPGRRLAAPVVVRLRDHQGKPLANQQIVFAPSAYGDADPQLGRTDANGYARTVWTLGPAVERQSLQVSGAGAALWVSANARRGTGTRISLVKRDGDEQTAAVRAQLPLSIQATVVRDDGSVIPGAVVTFTAGQGGRVDPATVRSTSAGVAQVRWTLGPGSGRQTLTASVPGAEPVAFTATATSSVARQPATLRLAPDSLVLDVGASSAFTAVIRDETGAQIPGNAPAWSSWDPGVATVDSLGNVRGVSVGTARVTARVGALSASGTVRVHPAVPVSIQVMPDSLALDVGATGQLTAVLRDAAGNVVTGPAPVWSSSSAAVAAVDAQGQVRGVAAGEAQVTATVGALSASARVRVRGRFPSLEIAPDSLVLDVGVWGRLFTVARDASGQPVLNHHLEWSTSADQVVFVDGGGNLLPMAPGTARITARWGNLTASATVRVRPRPRAGLTIPQIQKRVSSTGGSIDPSTRDVVLNWWIHLSERNVSAVSMRIRSPLGRTIGCTNVDAVSGFRNEFSCRLTLPRGSEHGVWHVDQVTVTKDGQTTTFTSADLDAMGTLGRRFDVFGPGADTQPPLVRTLWPHQGTRYSDRYYLQIGVVDHVSGVASVRITVRGPGGATHSCVASQSYGPLARVGGGVCLLPLRPGSGTWEVVSVEVQDGAGNRATYTPQQIAEMAGGMSEAPFFVYSFTP